MKYWQLITRSLVFYRRTHLAVFFGTAVCTAVLVGALVVGDSVKYSLAQLALVRLGRTEYALTSENRFFRSQLADHLSLRLSVDVSPVLNLSGIAVKADQGIRVGNIQVLGVDRRFWEMGGASEPGFKIGPHEAVINRRLAQRLNAQEGEEILLRVEKVKLIPGEMVFAIDSSRSTAMRFTVKAVAADEEFGRFSLRANQSAPFNIFLSLSWLEKSVDMDQRANILLIAGGEGKELTTEDIYSALKESWRLSDAGLRLRSLSQSQGLELRSERIFLEHPVAEAALLAGGNPRGILTYLVNSIRSGRKSTPYSFVSAAGEPIVPGDMGDDEIIINEWLAEDLGVSRGDRIDMDYYVPGSGQELIEQTSSFTVREVVSLDGPAVDRELIPDFPGLSQVESCLDWAPGVPIDLGRIRNKDEHYWNVYRGTPKAFVTLDSARRMWENRFGSLTAVRYDGGEEISEQILNRLEPASIGIKVIPVREEGIRSGMGAVDFGQLFIGLSMFLIGASIILTGLIYALGIEQRSEETGILCALGFNSAAVRRLRLAEGIFLAVSGSIVGTALGILYNQALLYGLSNVWRGAVGTSALKLHVKAPTLLFGALSGIGIAILTMWITVKRQLVKTPAQLQGAGGEYHIYPTKGLFRSLILVFGICLIGVSIATAISGAGTEGKPAGNFFISGGLLLIGSLLLCYALLLRIHRSVEKTRVSVFGMGVRGFARKPKRSLAVAGLFAFGIFIVFAVGANRSNSFIGADKKESGTGGFSLYGETTIPVLKNLNSERERSNFGLPGGEKKELSFVQIRVHEGDDASCLNLNRVQKPRILGVHPEEFARRGAFSFVKNAEIEKGESPWHLLNRMTDDDTIPAIADQSVITWGLHKTIGETLSYTDERGREFALKLVAGLKNSVFQGSVLISEKAFSERFPSESGSRVLLIDTPAIQIEQVSKNIHRALRDFGIELVPAAIRLAEFNRVQNTYLSIFLLLGGLGLLLGSFGMGLIVARNVLERRGELALFRAVGICKHTLHMMLLIEHLLMLGMGLICGIISSFIAVLPVLLHRGTDVPFLFLIILTCAVAVNGCAWTYLAVVLTTRGNLIPALRNE